MRVVLIVEGGGDKNSQLASDLRQGFRQLLERAGIAHRQIRIEQGGSRDSAYRHFTRLLGTAASDEHCLLLVDSDMPVEPGADVGRFLEQQTWWKKPQGCGGDDVHFMVQCMESWFLADPDTLEDYFGNGFHKPSLGKHREPERVSKKDVETNIKKATKKCKKGPYHKGNHSFAILGRCNPDVLREKMPYFKRLCDRLNEILQ